MSYKITDFSYQKAKQLNVNIKPSTNKNKKQMFSKTIKRQLLQVLLVFWKKNGLEYAYQRIKLYKLRHKKDLNSKKGFFANKILW